MELDPRTTGRLPFHDPDEAEPAYPGAAEPFGAMELRHLQRVPLFSGFNEDELRQVAELSRIVARRYGTRTGSEGQRVGLRAGWKYSHRCGRQDALRE
jgi:hypothetical protein